MTDNLASLIEAILFAAGESVPLARLSLVLGRDVEEITRTVETLVRAL